MKQIDINEEKKPHSDIYCSTLAKFFTAETTQRAAFGCKISQHQTSLITPTLKGALEDFSVFFFFLEKKREKCPNEIVSYPFYWHAECIWAKHLEMTGVHVHFPNLLEMLWDSLLCHWHELINT